MNIKRFNEILESKEMSYEDKLEKWKKSSVFQRQQWLLDLNLSKDKIEKYSKNNKFNLLPIDIVLNIKLDKDYVNTKREEKININYYQQILDKSNGLSISQQKYLQKIIDSIKSKGNKPTLRQKNILDRLVKGDFTYHSKN